VKLFTSVFTEWALHKFFTLLFPFIYFIVSKIKKKEMRRSPFDVALKMVSLLYFTQLSLVSVVFFPPGAILLWLLFLVNFKWEKGVLQLFQSKPKKTWKAKDAGSFFTRFYLLSTLFAYIAMHAVLATKTLPKMCTEQAKSLVGTTHRTLPDDVLAVEDQTCFLVKTNTSYAAGYASHLARNNNSQGATARSFCACRNACGPFIDDDNGYTSLVAMITSNSFTKMVYDYLVSNALSLWVLVLVLTCMYNFLGR
jgi:hypothetical protein